MKRKVKYDKEKGELSLDQEKYINFLMQKFGIMNNKLVDTPMVTQMKFNQEMEAKSKEEKLVMEGVPWRSPLGSLMYLMTSTRLDLAFAIRILSRFLHDLGR